MNDKSPVSILTIEDETIVRDSIVAWMSDEGYALLQAENGRVGLEMFRSHRPDVVLVDLRMPEVDGLEVLRVVSQESPHTPVIVVSGTGVVSDAIEAVRLGAWDYVLKPIEDMSALQHTVEKALERSRLLRQNEEYQQNLEEQVKQRTLELEETNEALRREIEHRKEAEAKSKEKEKHLETILEHLRAGVVVIEREGRTILDANPAALRMMGAEKNEVVGKVCYNHIFPSNLESCSITVGDLIEDNMEKVLLTVDGLEIPILKTAVPVTIGGRDCLLESFVDISAQKEAEEELRKSNDKMAIALDRERQALLQLEEAKARAEAASVSLAEKLEEVETFNRLAVGRELRMIELKEEVNGLLCKQGKPSKYRIVNAEAKA